MLASLIIQLINPKYQNNPINFVEIKFSSKINVSGIDTMRVEHSQSGRVCGCPNNILRYVAAPLIIHALCYPAHTTHLCSESRVPTYLAKPQNNLATCVPLPHIAYKKVIAQVIFDSMRKSVRLFDHLIVFENHECDKRNMRPKLLARLKYYLTTV